MLIYLLILLNLLWVRLIQGSYNFKSYFTFRLYLLTLITPILIIQTEVLFIITIVWFYGYDNTIHI